MDMHYSALAHLLDFHVFFITYREKVGQQHAFQNYSSWYQGSMKSKPQTEPVAALLTY